MDGVIIQTHSLLADDIERLVDANTAVVIHGNSATHPFADSVMIDEVKAAEEAVADLIHKGHVRVRTISGPEVSWVGRLRKVGYLNALQAHGIATTDELIYEMDFFGEGPVLWLCRNCWRCPSRLRPYLPLPNASLAVDALLYVVGSGLSVPEDVAIMGFDFWACVRSYSRQTEVGHRPQRRQSAEGYGRPTANSLSASKRNVQRLYPSGGFEQARAVTSALSWPLNLGGAPGRGFSCCISLFVAGFLGAKTQMSTRPKLVDTYLIM